MTDTYFSGRVNSVIFANETKAFYVLRMLLDVEANPNPIEEWMGSIEPLVTVCGEIPGVHVDIGAWFGFEGDWGNHPKYGRQIKVTRAPVLKGVWDEDMCEKILTSQGIGIGIAARIRTQFGKTMAEALTDVAQISTVPGLTALTAENIVHKWKMARAHFLTLEFLGDLGLPQGKIRHIWSTFGDTAKDVLSVNPWALVQIDGISFGDADAVGMRLGLDCSPANPARVEGAVLHASRAAKGFGNLYMSAGELRATAWTLDPNFADKDLVASVKALVGQGLLVVDKTTLPGTMAIYDPWSYKLEDTSATILKERGLQAVISPEKSAQYVKSLIGEENGQASLRDAGAQYLAQVEATGGITLSEKQKLGVINAITEPISIITGLPGSGKTTSLRMVLMLLHEMGVHPWMVAPTGIAAKRVESLTGVKAYTIHRAFGAMGADSETRKATYAGVVGQRDEDSASSDGSGEEWKYGPGKPHPAEMIVIDECFHYKQSILTESGWEYIGKVVEQRLPVRVWARNPSSGMLELKPILRYLKNPYPESGLLKLTVGASHSSRSGRSIRCTPEHKVLTPSGYQNAGDLRIGDDVVVRGVQPDTTISQVSGVTKFSPKRTYNHVYDLEIQDHHNYVAGNVIVSNCSMADQHVLYRILTCTRPDARLVFVGDAAQLPSVGPGNVLRDLVASGVYPTVALTEIFRQNEASPIIKAAHEIHRGVVPDAPIGSNFCLIEEHNEEEIANKIIVLAEKLYQARKNFQVMTPRHAGPIGVTALNARLRELLNPKQPSLQEIKLGKDVLREDDRIMVVKNNYQLGIFNGDTGKISNIDRKSKTVTIKIHGPPMILVQIPFEKCYTLLRLAYAVTVHRCQGQEMDIVVMPIIDSFAHQLQRNLFYTAITRAKEKVILIGSHSAMSRAVLNNQEDVRNTLFRNRLRAKVE